MRCVSCNTNLNDFESTRKYASGDYIDLCNHCFNSADMKDVDVIERADLAYSEDVTSDVEIEDVEGEY